MHMCLATLFSLPNHVGDDDPHAFKTARKESFEGAAEFERRAAEAHLCQRRPTGRCPAARLQATVDDGFPSLQSTQYARPVDSIDKVCEFGNEIGISLWQSAFVLRNLIQVITTSHNQYQTSRCAQFYRCSHSILIQAV